MTLLSLRQITARRGVLLFADLDLGLNAGDRLGLVAANGRGKSTLLSLMAGQAEPDAGTVIRARGLVATLAEQHPPGILMPLTFRQVLLTGLAEALADSENWRADILMDRFGLPEDLRDLPFDALSGGWQRMALLGRAAIGEPDLLLLDEPTNHLDLAKILLLEAFLRDLPRSTAVVIASHDRAFLDAVTTRSLFLRPQDSASFALPYSAARAALTEADLSQDRRFERDRKTADQLRRQAAKLNNIGINSGSDLLQVKTRQLRERAAALEEQARPAHREASAGLIRLEGKASEARRLVTLDGLCLSAPDGRPLFRSGRLFIVKGDRIVLLGANGSGKSRLIAALRQAILNPAAGDGPGIAATPSLVLGYGDQSLSDLDERESPLSALVRRYSLPDQRARALLAGAGIALEAQGRETARLSGGQKARLGLLILRLAAPSFFLLDEPTNHLDIEGQEALEAELKRSEAACLVTSHDRSFVRAIANRYWLIQGGRLSEVDGPEAYYDSLLPPA